VTAIGFHGGPVAGASFLVSLSFSSCFTPLFVSLGSEGDASIQGREMKWERIKESGEEREREGANSLLGYPRRPVYGEVYLSRQQRHVRGDEQGH
jgi:hypothetical protein